MHITIWTGNPALEVAIQISRVIVPPTVWFYQTMMLVDFTANLLLAIFSCQTMVPTHEIVVR